jgi:hypothetical protein
MANRSARAGGIRRSPGGDALVATSATGRAAVRGEKLPLQGKQIATDGDEHVRPTHALCILIQDAA